MTYRIDQSKSAIVHIRTCICFDLQTTKKRKNAKDIYKVTFGEHEEIMENMWCRRQISQETIWTVTFNYI